MVMNQPLADSRHGRSKNTRMLRRRELSFTSPHQLCEWMRLIPIKPDGFLTTPATGSQPHPNSMIEKAAPYQTLSDPSA